jgi:hypothetical protein
VGRARGQCHDLGRLRLLLPSAERQPGQASARRDVRPGQARTCRGRRSDSHREDHRRRPRALSGAPTPIWRAMLAPRSQLTPPQHLKSAVRALATDDCRGAAAAEPEAKRFAAIQGHRHGRRTRSPRGLCGRRAGSRLRAVGEVFFGLGRALCEQSGGPRPRSGRRAAPPGGRQMRSVGLPGDR